MNAFGYEVYDVEGHNVDAIKEILAEPQKGNKKAAPKAIVANTIKGFGCSLLCENQYEWHRKSPSEEQLCELLEELNA